MVEADRPLKLPLSQSSNLTTPRVVTYQNGYYWIVTTVLENDELVVESLKTSTKQAAGRKWSLAGFLLGQVQLKYSVQNICDSI